jgi:hypothetical protein
LPRWWPGRGRDAGTDHRIAPQPDPQQDRKTHLLGNFPDYIFLLIRLDLFRGRPPGRSGFPLLLSAGRRRPSGGDSAAGFRGGFGGFAAHDRRRRASGVVPRIKESEWLRKNRWNVCWTIMSRLPGNLVGSSGGADVYGTRPGDYNPAVEYQYLVVLDVRPGPAGPGHDPCQDLAAVGPGLAAVPDAGRPKRPPGTGFRWNTST